MNATSEHGKPAQDMECLATMDEITMENYCEYQTYPSMKWFPCLFSSDVVKLLLQTQFHNYMKAVQQPDCKAELRRLLTSGPPIFVSDKHAMTLPPEDDHVHMIWYAGEASTSSAKLDGAVEGEEREKLWNELKQLLVEEEKEQEQDSKVN